MCLLVAQWTDDRAPVSITASLMQALMLVLLGDKQNKHSMQEAQRSITQPEGCISNVFTMLLVVCCCMMYKGIRASTKDVIAL